MDDERIVLFDVLDLLSNAECEDFAKTIALAGVEARIACAGRDDCPRGDMAERIVREVIDALGTRRAEEMF